MKTWRIGLGVLALGALVLALWMLWRPTPPAPGILEANGRIEGDQAAVGAKIGGKLAIQNPQGILKPGMPVDARLRWSPQAPWGDRLE